MIVKLSTLVVLSTIPRVTTITDVIYKSINIFDGLFLKLSYVLIHM